MDPSLNTVEQTLSQTTDLERAYAELERVNAQLARALRDAATGLATQSGPATAAQLRQEADHLALRQAEFDAADATIADLRAYVETLETALASTRSSLSWRVTRPLRAAKSLLARKHV